MCIRDRGKREAEQRRKRSARELRKLKVVTDRSVSYTHLRAHETPEHLVCRLLLEKKRGPPRSTRVRSSAASDVYKRQRKERGGTAEETVRARIAEIESGD